MQKVKLFLAKQKRTSVNVIATMEIFTYSDNGFTVKTKNGDKTIEWIQVSKLTGYKRDYFTTDCICLVVDYDNGQNFDNGGAFLMVLIFRTFKASFSIFG